MAIDHATIQQAILGVIPPDGSSISNKKLVALLAAKVDGATPEDCRRARDDLIAAGRLPATRLGVRLAGADGAAGQGLAAGRGAGGAGAGASAYQHADDAVQRPDVGVEAQFSHRKQPRTYRHDSSLAPELRWDESAERPFAEWLLRHVVEATKQGESTVFAQPRVWPGTGEPFSPLAQCAARLRSLMEPFLSIARGEGWRLLKAANEVTIHLLDRGGRCPHAL